MSDGRRWFEQAPPEPQPGSRARDDDRVEQLWVRCPGCKETLYKEHLAESQQVCSHCGYHMRIGALERLEAVLDPGSLRRHDRALSAVDPLGFVDSKPYPDRLERSRRKTGEADAWIGGSATIDGIPVQVGSFNFAFMGGSMGSAASAP